MLPKSARLGADEVRQVLAEGRSVRAGALSAKVLPVRGPSQAAVVVPKSAVKSAVGRNRLRRAVYAALRVSLPREGSRVVLFARPTAAETLAQDVHTLCSKLS